MSSKKLKRVIEAESLAKSDKHEDVNKAIKIYKELCLTSMIDPEERIEIIVSFLKLIPDEGKEILIRFRDLIPFVNGPELRNLVKLLVLICKHPEIEPHERCITATTLYNQCMFDVCFSCFESIAMDKTVTTKYRVEACRYLFFSELPINKELSQECLVEIIENLEIPSDQRYKIIAGFISRTGFSSYLNSKKIPIPYDEEFVYGLQTPFFYETANGIRERILSGQHICSMDHTPEEEKVSICETFLDIARDDKYEENVRADAADVVLRMGRAGQPEIARSIITELGYSALGKTGSLMDKVRTVYNNSQNIHDENISKHVNKFIEKIVEESKLEEMKEYKQVQKEVIGLVKSKEFDKTEKYKIYGALNRISLDTAVFTKYNITMSQLFIIVWIKINQHEKETKGMLEDRLLQELMEMSETCSSGHAGRFVNVFAGVDADINISYEDQITANLAGRIKARIRDIPDSDVRASVSMATFPDASEEDIEIYKTFMDAALESIRAELYGEFVGDGYITHDQFVLYFENAKKAWVL